MFPMVSSFSFPSEYKINSNFQPWRQCRRFTSMDYNEVGFIDVCAHLDFHEVVWTSSQGLPLDWTEIWILPPATGVEDNSQTSFVRRPCSESHPQGFRFCSLELFLRSTPGFDN